MRRWARRLARVALGLAVLAWAIYAGVFWWYQESFLFPVPTWTDAAGLAEVAARRGVEPLDLVDDRGAHVLGWHHRSAPPEGPGRLLVFFSGNGEALSDYLAVHDVLVASGWDTLTVAWSGYPGSPGEPGEAAMAANARAAWAWAAGHFPADRVVVHGRSLGGAVAAELVDGGARPAGLVLESTFTRVGAVVGRQAPGLPLFLLLRHPFRTLDRAPRLRLPTLVLHSRDDQLIPPEIGGRTLAAALPDARYVEVGGWSHQDDLPLSDAEARQAWLAFLEERVPR